MLSAPSGTTLADSTGTARLMNLKGRIGIAALDTAVVRSAASGNTATVTVSLTTAPAAGETVTVNVATANGTATAGTDFTALGDDPAHVHRGRASKTVTDPGPGQAGRHADAALHLGPQRTKRQRIRR